VRFGLEVASLVGLGRGGWALGAGTGWAWVGAAALPLVATGLWVTFAVKGDPSRSGRAPIPVPGWARLGLELGVFAGGAAGLAVSGLRYVLGAFALGLLVHHAGTTPRLAWLLRQRGGG
jgi:hypothetical protein